MQSNIQISDIHLSLRSLIGLATREYVTRRTLVSSRRKRTSTQLKQRWMLPMCRRRLARLTLRQRQTQVPCAPSHLPLNTATTYSLVLTELNNTMTVRCTDVIVIRKPHTAQEKGFHPASMKFSIIVYILY